MKVLVTGSEGFVGRHVVKAFLRRGDVVLGADKKTGQDVTKPETASLLVGWEPDVVVHLAATCSTPASLERPMESFTDTVLSAVTMLEAVRVAGRQTPFLLTSSVKARDGMTPYGASKVMAETWAMEYARSYGLPVVINRPGTIYGPGQEGSPESGWVAWFLKARREKIEVTINGSGLQIRDLLHVSDYARLVVMQATDPAAYAGEIWDVGGGFANAVRVREMADALGLAYRYGPHRVGDAATYIGENRVPGWVPEITWHTSETFRDFAPERDFREPAPVRDPHPVAR